MPPKKGHSTPSPSPAEGPKKAKRRRGRPEGQGFKPTQEQRQLVEAACGIGIPEAEIVQVVINPQTKKPISPITLRKHFRPELDAGLIKTKMRVGGALVRNALGVAPTEHHAGHPGNVTAQIFYLKTQAGWKETEPAEPPPPPAADADDVGRLEVARRIAFALIDGARRAPPKGLPAPATKKPARTHG